MPFIDIAVREKIAASPAAKIVCGNSDYIINFAFDEEWDAASAKTARFIYDGKYTDVIFTGTNCAAPVIENATICLIGVFAGDLHTTTPAVVECEKSILCGGGSPAEPPADVYAQIMQLINKSVISGADIGENAHLIITTADGSTYDAGECRGAAGKSPYIGENGNWYTFDDQSGEYIDSGISASSGGGSSEIWRLVQDITLDTDDVGTLEFTTDSDGNALNLKKFALIGKAKASGSASCYITINGKAFLSTQTPYQTFNFRPFQLQGDFNKGFLTLQLVGANNTAVNGVSMYTHIRTGDFASSALEKIEGSGLTQFKISPQSATVTFLTGSHFELWGVDA